MNGTTDIEAAGERRTPVLNLQTVAFTGRLATMTRARAWTLVISHGGTPTPVVHARTTMLVIGMHGWPLLPDGTPTRAIAQAEQLQRRGRGVRILGEEAFLELIGERERGEGFSKQYEISQVERLTGLDTATIRLWDRLGLVRSHDDLYDFRDLVSLQTIARLLREGVDPRTIRTSIRSLGAILPGTERPLAQLELVVRDGGAIAARLGDAVIDPQGQLQLGFGLDTPPMPADPESLRLADSLPMSEGEWIDAGLAAEDDGRLDEAEDAYRRAIAMAPSSVEAQFNLANVLRERGQRAAAEERYRQTIALEPTFLPAWYNLSIVLDDAGREGEAALVLERCLELDATFADAVYNLAELYERTGRGSLATPLWRTFLKLEPNGEWAARARARLTGA